MYCNESSEFLNEWMDPMQTVRRLEDMFRMPSVWIYANKFILFHSYFQLLTVFTECVNKFVLVVYSIILLYFALLISFISSSHSTKFCKFSPSWWICIFFLSRNCCGIHKLWKSKLYTLCIYLIIIVILFMFFFWFLVCLLSY